MTYLGTKPPSMSTPREPLGRSLTWPMEARTSYPEPRKPARVRALAGDSTMTRFFLRFLGIAGARWCALSHLSHADIVHAAHLSHHALQLQHGQGATDGGDR